MRDAVQSHSFTIPEVQVCKLEPALADIHSLFDVTRRFPTNFSSEWSSLLGSQPDSKRHLMTETLSRGFGDIWDPTIFPELKQLLNPLVRLVLKSHPSFLSSLSLIVSEPGCEPQLYHCDFNYPVDVLGKRHSQQPFTMVLPLVGPARVMGFKSGVHAECTGVEDISIPFGWYARFSGKQIHRGGANPYDHALGNDYYDADY